MRNKKRKLLLLVMALVFLVALTPNILSSSYALRFVVNALDSRVPGSLSIDSWLVGWKQGILCQQVVYTDPELGVHLVIPKLTSTQGLLELLLAPNNLGQLILDGPQLEVREDAKRVAGKDQRHDGRASSPVIPLWNHLAGDMEIRGGRVTLVHTDPALVTGFRDLSLSASLSGGVLGFTLEVTNLADSGSAKVTASLNLPVQRKGWLDTMVAEGKFSASSLQLRDLLSLVARKSNRMPSGEGLLTATDLRFKTVGLEQVELDGRIDLAGMQLRDGILGADTPSFAQLRLTVDGGRLSAAGWRANAFDLDCDTAHLDGAGQFAGGELKLAGKGRVNLPVLFAQFPRLLHAREDLEVETGTLDFNVDFGTTGDRQQLDLKLRMDALGGKSGGEAFLWDDPVSVLANGERNGKDIQVNALQVEGPFLRFDGRGNPRSFVADASADLNQASIELGRLLALDWKAAGEVLLSMRGRDENDGDQPRTAEAEFRISDFALQRGEENVVPPHEFSLLARGGAQQAENGREVEAVDLQFVLSSWLGETYVTVSGEKKEDQPLQGYFSTDTTLELDSATGLLHVLKILPKAASVGGEMQVQATGSINGDEIEVREFTGEIGGLVLAREGASFAEKLVRLEIGQSINEEVKVVTLHNLLVAENREDFFRTGYGSNVVNLGDHSLFLHNLNLHSATASIKLDKLVIPDWRSPVKGLGADLVGDFDLQWVTGLLSAVAMWNGNPDLAGRGRLSLQAGEGGSEGQLLSAELRANDVRMVRDQRKILLSKELRLAVQLSPEDEEGDIKIIELRFDADPLQIAGTGMISRDQGRRKAEVQGRLTPSLERISRALRNGYELDLQLSGGQVEPFLAEYSFAETDEGGRRGLSLQTSLHADRLEYRGEVLRALHMPLTLENNKLRLEVKGGIGPGKVELGADIDLAAAPVVVSAQQAQRVLVGVPVEDPLGRTLLSSMHPLFGVLAIPAGLFDLRLNSFDWPLVGNSVETAEFEAVTDMQNVSLQSSDILRQILGLFGLEQEKLDLADTELVCSRGHAVFSCQPFNLKIGESELTMSGSLTDDGRLDYMLEVPVTLKLVNADGFRVLQGRTVKVPVQGTVNEPSFDRNRTLDAIGELLQEAATRLVEEKNSGLGDSRPDGPDSTKSE